MSNVVAFTDPDFLKSLSPRPYLSSGLRLSRTVEPDWTQLGCDEMIVREGEDKAVNLYDSRLRKLHLLESMLDDDSTKFGPTCKQLTDSYLLNGLVAGAGFEPATFGL